MAPDYPLLSAIEQKRSEQFLETINGMKIRKYLLPDPQEPQDFEEIRDMIGAYEIAIVDLWRHAFGGTDREKKRHFHKACKDCFDLLQLLPIPSERVEKIKHVLKLFAYAYLGEKWEDMRRLWVEKEAELRVETEVKSWDLRLLSKIYMAILHLIMKKTWSDLSKAGDYIGSLKGDQNEYETGFLKRAGQDYEREAALELASYYHLAVAVELLGKYMLGGGATRGVISSLDYHFDAAIGCCQGASIMELELLLRVLKLTFKKMVENSIWNVTGQINSRVTKFIESITRREQGPVFELLYPQRAAILEQRLLDPALKAIVVNLPTSSGKTIIAEFRILQALNQFSEIDGKIVYVVPTRALVNQITARLRRDLGVSGLDVKIEKMSGAIEIDSFEESILESNFDVLVTTPEKLNLLIRDPEKREFARNIVLAVIDEAHNISNRSRGLNLEMLISNIQSDCERAHLLLMTPFIPNHEEVARWLDPLNPQSIHMELEWWQPNDKVVGLYYAEGDRGGSATYFQPLVTHSKTLELRDRIKLGESAGAEFSIGKVRSTLARLTAITASHLRERQNILVLGSTMNHTWLIAKHIAATTPNHTGADQNLDLVAKYVAAELGESFPLVGYIRKGIGVHNAGLPDDIRELVEWLMEEGSLRILVATSTVAQGMNFPVNCILVASYKRPREGPMPFMEFWNLVGRAGRIDQRSLGAIGIAVDRKDSKEAEKAGEYVMNSTEELVSVLKKMVDEATELGRNLDLSARSNDPEWSSFLQYISHMYRQSGNVKEFVTAINVSLSRTYGYNQLSQRKRNVLTSAVRDYAHYLGENMELVTLSDRTGFTTETIQKAISSVKASGIKPSEWNSHGLFSGRSTALAKLTGIMLDDIPETSSILSEVVGTKTNGDSISKIIADWVSGRDIHVISKKHFGGTDTAAMSKCVRAIYGKITNSATWGLAALQKLPASGIRVEELSEEERRRLANLPAMIFYGVDTDEAILMRLNNVPRSISKTMGKRYRRENPKFHKARSGDVITWLKDLDARGWDEAVPQDKRLSGTEYKKIWEKLSGTAPDPVGSEDVGSG